MEVPCVRVDRDRGEETRKRLAEADLLAEAFQIEAEEGLLYLPVEDPDAVPEEMQVVTRAVEPRDTQDTPADLLGFEPSYARLGDVVILDEDDPERAREIADAVMASDLPVDSVLNRDSKVKGELRIRDWKVLAGEGAEIDGAEANEAQADEAETDEASQESDVDSPKADSFGDDSPGTETVHREYGNEFLLDVAEVYFSPRLATERHRVAEQVQSGEQAFDMFAGVGPFVIPFAERGAEVVGVDLNERAVEFLRENARRNGVEDRVTAIHGNVREVAPDYADWADRIVMNLPHSAADFLDSAVTLAGDDCALHYYDIQHEEDPFGPGEAAIREAAEPEYEVEVLNRHVVRSYAPHELNVCLDVRLTR